MSCHRLSHNDRLVSVLSSPVTVIVVACLIESVPVNMLHTN